MKSTMAYCFNIGNRLSKKLFFAVALFQMSCGEKVQDQKPLVSQQKQNEVAESIPNNLGQKTTELANDIGAILQDYNGHYWFTSKKNGVYRFDGNDMFHFTTKEGLCTDFGSTIQEDGKGNLWFSSGGNICCFDGKKFQDFSNDASNGQRSSLELTSTRLFFGREDEICYYNGERFINFSIHPDTKSSESEKISSSFGMYAYFIDKDGYVWFGTANRGVCRFDGINFNYITDKGLDDAPVRAIYQDLKGDMWFGNNGAGLFQYDGKTLTNFTDEHHLSNPEFLKAKEVSNKKGTLARVFSITEDKLGNLWIATADAGVWCYDGKQLKNYTTSDGLTSDAVLFIYRDHRDELWFATYDAGVCKFDGQRFYKFQMKAESSNVVE